jgi:hypothetical protein
MENSHTMLCPSSYDFIKKFTLFRKHVTLLQHDAIYFPALHPHSFNQKLMLSLWSVLHACLTWKRDQCYPISQ